MRDLQPQKLVYRDGVSQSQRLTGELDPAYVSIEERSMADLLRFARELSGYINFYDIDNTVKGDWGGFLNSRPDTADAGQWLNGLFEYADDPAKFAAQPEKAQMYSSPHLSLFITFLKLLGRVKTQLNTFTQKHLDLYYHELLGLDKKKPVPDAVNIIVQLGNELETLLLEKGTRITAGRDREGKDLVYKTQKETLVTKAAVKNIKSLYVNRRSISLADQWNASDPKGSVKNMLSTALGYNTFDPDNFINADGNIDEALVTSEAIKYELSSDALILIIEFATRKHDPANITKLLTALTNGYRLQLLSKRRPKNEAFGSAFALLALALGDADGNLPKYNDKVVTVDVLTNLNDLLEGDDALLKALATKYITSLSLTVADFARVASIAKERIIDGAQWLAVYTILNSALTKKGISPEVPPQIQWVDISVTKNAKINEASQFQTFGDMNGTIADTNTAIGFAISSPNFALSEGNRTVDLYLSLGRMDEFNKKELIRAFNAQRTISPLFRFFIGLNGAWKEISAQEIQFNDYIPIELGTDIDGATLNNQKLTISTQTPHFDDKDAGYYIVTKFGGIFIISTVNSPTSVNVIPVAQISRHAGMKKYNPADVYLNTLHVQLNFDEQKPPNAFAPLLPNGLLGIANGPVLAIVLNNIKKVRNVYGIMDWYQQLQGFCVEKIKVDINVTGLRALTIQNDFSVLNPKTPFEPFGPAPEHGTRFYFSHHELAGKTIDSLTLNFEWMNAPADFKDHYADYLKVYNNKKNTPVKPVTGNDYFVAKLDMVTDDRPAGLNIPFKLFGDNAPGRLPGNNEIPFDKLNTRDEVINWKRYFSLELLTDFGHSVYPLLLAKQMQAYNDAEMKALNLNAPYTPKVKHLTAGYSSSFVILPGQADTHGSFFNIGPFGYTAYRGGNNEPAGLLPQFANSGELYIGLTGLQQQQNLSILFQMAEGTADPELAKPAVTWSYLKNDQWINFSVADIVTDTTRQLSATGIVELNIPGDMTDNNTSFGEGLYWLKAAVLSNTTAIPDTADIIAQSVNAVFTNQDNAKSHYTDLLEPEHVKTTIDNIPGIKKLLQPFASTGGKPEETDGMFYVRVSERLRHKNRAFTLWDYERLVLGQFPEIYKVKCMPGNFSDKTADDTGKVDIIVLPNTRGKLTFDQFQPRVSSELLLNISSFLEARIPPFVSIVVRNPVYVTIEVRTAVRIKHGYSEEFYRLKLIEDLKRFLSPWAYDENADIIIGGNIYNNVIVNFIARLPYIDHVATIRLSQSMAGGPFKPFVNTDGSTDNAVAASPDIVLVSADSHDILLLKDDEFSPELMEGIGYMAIENDFMIP